MGEQDFAGQTQPEADAIDPSAATAIRAVETPEDPGLVLGRNARA